ncbi:MAG: radical SAM family heme chaperone HemW [Oscillospiraceae bacterium]|nr:radical SAM family heme chaperone HemW [Oscillospiraceae bacterium]
MLGLYIHIPFCRQKCIYCDFYSMPRRVPDGYVDAVIRNIKAYGRRYDTVFFGGGTPSLMSPRQIGDILSAADISVGAEITMEANPETVDAASLAGYRDAGIGRISFGVQSFDDEELRMLGRIHDADTAVRAIDTASRYFDDISADIMLGLPRSDETKLRSTLDTLLSLPLTHISAYMLKVEDGTPLSRRKDLLDCIDEDMTADMYELTADTLIHHGYRHYEISNFALPGHECRHNLNYWRCGEYIGIGPAAYSCTGGVRSHVPSDTELFMSSPVQVCITDDDAACSEEERMMLALRLSEGYETEDTALLDRAGVFASRGLMTICGGRMALTTAGMLVSNEIIAELMCVMKARS